MPGENEAAGFTATAATIRNTRNISVSNPIDIEIGNVSSGVIDSNNPDRDALLVLPLRLAGRKA